MPSPKVAFLTGLPPKIVDAVVGYTPDGWTTDVIYPDAPADDRARRVADADFIMVYRAALPDAVLRAAKRARIVQTLAAGYDSLNLRLMRELEIPCCNNGGANSRAVADHAVMLMLAVYKQLMAAHESTRAGRWSAPIDGFNTFEMADKLIGIVGFGNIGQQVAKRVLGFEARVQYYDPFPQPPERERELGVSRAELGELFRTSDIVTIHAPLTPHTRHIASAEMIGRMKQTAVLINTSRGPTVDEPALIAALRKGEIAAAGLDVFEQEPVAPDNPLLSMSNVVATPHSAGTTWDTWFRRAEFAYRNMQAVWNGDPPTAVARDYDMEG